MRTILLSILLLFAITVNAQRITLNQIIKFQNQNVSEFEDHLLELGYEPDNIGSFSGKSQTYDFCKNPNSSKYRLSISKLIYDSYNVQINVLTRLSSEYIDIKNSLISNGFKYVKTIKKNKMVLHSYEKGVYRFDISTYNFDDGILYGMTIINKDNEMKYHLESD